MTVLERCGIQSHCVRPSRHQTRSRAHFRRFVGRTEAWQRVSWRSSGRGSLSWNGRKTVTARRTAVCAAGSSIDSSPILRTIVPAIVAASVALPLSAGAAEDLPPNLIDFFNTWLVQIEELGPWGPVLFVLTVTSAELIPLFPTQPLSLAGGLLFGATKGGLCVWVAANLAALLAFSLSKGVGRSLAERVIAAEMGSERAEGEAGPLERVQQAIESGQLWQQFVAVLLLRLTPVVPFSASNYVLGLTPLDARAFFCATCVGMLVWSAVFASLGGAGRQLLDGGQDLESVFSGLVDQASTYTNAAGMLILATGGVALLFALARRLSDADDRSEVVDPPREDGSWLGESTHVETSVMETRSKAKAANRSE